MKFEEPKDITLTFILDLDHSSSIFSGLMLLPFSIRRSAERFRRLMRAPIASLEQEGNESFFVGRRKVSF